MIVTGIFFFIIYLRQFPEAKFFPIIYKNAFLTNFPIIILDNVYNIDNLSVNEFSQILYAYLGLSDEEIKEKRERQEKIEPRNKQRKKKSKRRNIISKIKIILKKEIKIIVQLIWKKKKSAAKNIVILMWKI